MKSNSPCLPGFLPVMKLDHAQGVIGGMVDSSRLRAPLRSTRPRCGRRPCSIQGSIRSNVAPSNPTIKTEYLRDGIQFDLRRTLGADVPQVGRRVFDNLGNPRPLGDLVPPPRRQ